MKIRFLILFSIGLILIPVKKTQAKTIIHFTISNSVSTDSLVSKLNQMKTDTLDCTADIYWKIIKRGKASIPFLIERLTDSTKTNIYNNCKKDKLTIGEVAYFALEEIAEFPALIVTQIQFDVISNGCWNFYDYFFNQKNKIEYQKMVRKFYKENKFIYTKYNDSELNSCQIKYKITGKYKLIK